MSFSSTELLQFGDLKNLVAGYCGSAAGRALVQALEPNRDRAALEADLAEAGEAISYLRELAGPQETARGCAVRLRFDQLREIEPAVRILQMEGASLDGPQILALFHTLAIAGEYQGVLLSVAARYPRLARRANGMADLRDIAHRHQRAFLPDGSVADEASATLRRIRRDIERQRKNIQESLERFLRAHRADGTLQEDFVTIREDRYVVPIVAGQKGRIDGVIHGSSGTGRTLFVEPLETIDLNNQLVRLKENELREIERILAEITNALQEHSAEIAATAETLAQLDCIFAKAGFAIAYDAVIPRFCREPRKLLLREARHPLLEAVLHKQRKPIVPISFELDEAQRCLLISGPNTGGKTVLLKTSGLLALMAHAALPVPCAEAEFPLLDDVVADIGDTQSIAESLSSFSGHLLHIKEMLKRVTPDSLILLDELGSATDPEEGGALGVAILDEFRKSGAFCLASTHLLPLKLYGGRVQGVLNGSMGFNKATLEPTYELRLGMPGRSAGLDIAERLEMPETVLAHARSIVPRLQADFQELLAELHRQTEENARRQEEMEETSRQLTKRREELEQEAVRREQQRQREWEKKSESILADFERRAERAMERLAEIAERRKAAERAQSLIAETKREFRKEADKALAPTLVPEAAPKRFDLEEGARVRLRDVREIATLRRRLKNGMLEVEAGFLKMQVYPEDVTEVVSPGGEAGRRKLGALRESTALRSQIRPEGGDILSSELNIIGQRAEEAIEQVDKFLDSAALASVNRVRIIHGHGMGVLKRAVSEFLGTNPHVSRFYSAAQSEGGTGATIVELRD